MPQLFAVIRTRGPAWQESRPLEGQADWSGHASFMNSLAKEGFVFLGGQLEGTSDRLLVGTARTPDEVRSRLAEDPWEGTGSFGPFASHPGRCDWALSRLRREIVVIMRGPW